MINILDVIIAALALFYLLKNAGGILKTVKNLLIVLLALIFFGVIARLVIDLPLPGPLKTTMEESYFIKLSHFLLRGIYPAVESSAPKVDSFIKEKIISAPTKEVPLPALPKVTLPENVLPKVNLQDLLKGQ